MNYHEVLHCFTFIALHFQWSCWLDLFLHEGEGSDHLLHDAGPGRMWPYPSLSFSTECWHLVDCAVRSVWFDCHCSVGNCVDVWSQWLRNTEKKANLQAYDLKGFAYMLRFDHLRL